MDGKYTEKADVYSFGLLLGEIYNQHPFDHYRDQSEKEIIKKLQEKSTSGILFHPDCPQNLQKLIEICLQADPSKRPSFLQLVLQLKSMLIGK